MTSASSARACDGMELGLYTFGDLVVDPVSAKAATAATRLREVVEAAKLADESGLDVFGVGEHHRLDCAISSPPVVLSAIAPLTRRIRLSSATTVLPTIDPVRVFEDFATLDLLSDGRAEIIAGRGAFVESYPLFGYDLNDRDALFAEHLDVLLRCNASSRVTWQGKLRSALSDAEIAPRPLRGELPIWVGVGATAASASRAGSLGLRMSLAILGTSARMKPLVDGYRRAGIAAGHPADRLEIGIASHMFLHEDSQQARDLFHPRHAAYFRAMGRPGLSRSEFDALVAPPDGLLVGSPAEVADKILLQHELFGHDRYIAQCDIGGLPYRHVANTIELFANEVAPSVRRATKKLASG